MGTTCACPVDGGGSRSGSLVRVQMNASPLDCLLGIRSKTTRSHPEPVSTWTLSPAGSSHWKHGQPHAARSTLTKQLAAPTRSHKLSSLFCVQRALPGGSTACAYISAICCMWFIQGRTPNKQLWDAAVRNGAAHCAQFHLNDYVDAQDAYISLAAPGSGCVSNSIYSLNFKNSLRPNVPV